MKKFPPISAKIPSMLHGADYNPEQWLSYPEVLEEDIRLMKLAKCNVMSVGIFSWVSLEPEEGVHTFDWLDRVLDTFQENGIYAFLATPSGARPAWMSEKYPEVLRVNANRSRNLHGARHNHCFSSPVYREKVKAINTKLAQRYAEHPAVIGWHISNEYGGDCHCDYCLEAFRGWVKDKYGTLEELNHAWWTTFWSHTLTEWSQIESPALHGENAVHGMNLDWKRFVTDQTVDFLKHETAPIKEKSNLPVTTNFMEAFEGLNYWKFTDIIDVVSWDAYPTWHDKKDDSEQAAWFSLLHDLKRSLKGGKPFMLMESTPSSTNWQDVSKLKRPGMHALSSIQAVAHGSDTVQYFQWRKSRGSSEKLHGAVVDHYGKEDTRVFQEVAGIGDTLQRLDEIVGTTVIPEVAIIFDWENRWAMKDAQGPRNIGIHYEEQIRRHYRPLWDMGVPVDIIDMDCDLSKYKLVIAPMLYMVRPGVGERIEQFVQEGGVFVTTYWSGIVNENDLCFLGGFPGPLRKTLGIWSEEIDSLHEGEVNLVKMEEDHSLGLSGEFETHELCDLIHLEGAISLASYQKDFYAGRPALTVNHFGKGKAYYEASRNKEPFYTEFLGALVEENNIQKVTKSSLPHGVTAQKRSDGESDFIFVMNFSPDTQTIKIEEEFTDLIEGNAVPESVVLQPYGFKILKTGLSNEQV
ncbi:beta-galactosidase [Jeotgalibacillus proteolyticus]|uniref:Beta-galactosidase n=2 Tax=Jeotgalibacillus proteolyticus TaxID=2082395 RepID=A0A2S5G9P5_9BACL|nr:beta-galactosidase [Jeotgalibacillus proteolyticus]PPA69641.1 beta-galactosidase [Jeotgalibacillus proteolyticus]